MSQISLLLGGAYIDEERRALRSNNIVQLECRLRYLEAPCYVYEGLEH